ncbi:MAG: hypothetical protein ACTSQJ_07245 [Promethearchaeota archaeon]
MIKRKKITNKTKKGIILLAILSLTALISSIKYVDFKSKSLEGNNGSEGNNIEIAINLNPIIINDNWSDTADKHDWCYGDGTPWDPYIIENVVIDAQSQTNGISILNSNDFFIIRNCTIFNADGFDQ